MLIRITCFAKLHQVIQARTVHGLYALKFSNNGEMIAIAVGKSVQIYDRALEYKFELKELGHEKVGVDSQLLVCTFTLGCICHCLVK